MIALNTRPLIQRKTLCKRCAEGRRCAEGLNQERLAQVVNALVIGKGALKGERCDKAHETLLIRHRL